MGPALDVRLPEPLLYRRQASAHLVQALVGRWGAPLRQMNLSAAAA